MPPFSPAVKVKYARAFMLRYSNLETLEWFPLFDNDAGLLLQFADRSSAAPRRRTSTSLATSGRRERPRERLRTNRPEKKSRVTKAKTCYSRIKVSSGKCGFSPCRFSHACISCGGDHPASACRNWDQSKADAYLAKGGLE